VGCNFAADRAIGTETGQHTVPISEWQFARSPFDKLSPELHRAIFSPDQPTALRGKCYLAAVFPHALKLLDINSATVMNDNEFRDFAAGIMIKKGSQPLAHNYGAYSVRS
jgi:hypothetical protein